MGAVVHVAVDNPLFSGYSIYLFSSSRACAERGEKALQIVCASTLQFLETSARSLPRDGKRLSGVLFLPCTIVVEKDGRKVPVSLTTGRTQVLGEWVIESPRAGRRASFRGHVQREKQECKARVIPMVGWVVHSYEALIHRRVVCGRTEPRVCACTVGLGTSLVRGPHTFSVELFFDGKHVAA